ncbi:MAG: dienelactone hydrolase family protein [bacterium]
MTVLSAVVLLAALTWTTTPSTFGATTTVTVGVKNNISALLIAPDGPGPYPGVLVLGTGRGLEQYHIQVANRLAAAGYVCLAPRYLEAYGLTGEGRFEGFTTMVEPIYADLAQAVDVLKHDPKVAGGPVAAMGFSHGGFYTVLLAARGKVDAGVDYYGAVSANNVDANLTRFRSSITEQSSPMLLLVGTKDGYYKATVLLSHMLRDANVRHRLIVYKGLGHEFDREDPKAAQDAWQKTLGFLAFNLKKN